jgi:hypothetical protein
MTTERRTADYSLLKIAEAFEPAAPEASHGTCGNIQSQVYGDPFIGKSFERNPDYAPLYDRVSAPMMLARLCSLFHGLRIDVGGQEYYKVTWTVVLRHKETGHVVTFYDWKGGSSIGSDVYGKGTPKSFIRDVKKLVEVLCNERCPHPYDGCVVGEIA